MTRNDGVTTLADAVATSTTAVTRLAAGEIDMNMRAGVPQSTAPVRLPSLPVH